jgi:hypothetical protein
MKAASNSDTEPTGDYEVGYGKPPRRAGFQKGRSGNPKGRPKGSKNFATLLAEALDEKVQVTEDGKRRRITKRALVIRQLVNKSASADLRAIKQLTDIVQGIEGRTGASQAPPPPQAFTAADEEVIAELKKRIERDIRAKIAPEEPSPIVTPAEAGVQEPTYPEVAPSARPQGWACLGQALDSRLRGNDE